VQILHTPLNLEAKVKTHRFQHALCRAILTIMKKNILVIGGAGYIGSACVNQLVQQGHAVVVFDNLSTGQPEKIGESVGFAQGDIMNPAELDAVCGAHQFDAVFHFAAKKVLSESMQNPTLYYQNNVVGTLNILGAMEKHSIPEIIFSSTAAVYEPQEDINDLYVEDSKTAPVSVYGSTKLIAEMIIKDFARTGKIQKYSILRYFNVAGDAGLSFAEHNAQNVFPLLAGALTTGEPFHIFGTDYLTKDGTAMRDYIHLTDLVDGHLKALETEKSGTYNLGTGTGYSVRELVDAFERISGKKLTVKESPRRPGDLASVIASPAKANSELNWYPTKTLDDMVQDTLIVFSK